MLEIVSVVSLAFVYLLIQHLGSFPKVLFGYKEEMRECKSEKCEKEDAPAKQVRFNKVAAEFRYSCDGRVPKNKTVNVRWSNSKKREDKFWQRRNRIVDKRAANKKQRKGRQRINSYCNETSSKPVRRRKRRTTV
mmetsp:Transcript_12876/g.23383  ORF Transcript_12876/g.23383 Transcript_12876/m.23383 type:complete len:135 (-) Transcript_12876:444-848(-)